MCVCVCVCVCGGGGVRGLRMKLKSCNIGVGMPRDTGSRRKVTRGEEGMSQSTLRHSKWEQESKERESVVIREISRLE